MKRKLLMEGPYCNPGGGDPNNIPGCHERGVGCLSYGVEPAYFGQMGQCSTCDPEWACVSIAPGGNDGPLHADVSLTKADLQNTGRIDKSLDSIRLRESELVNLIKRVINEQSNWQYTPNIQGDPNIQASTCNAINSFAGCNLNCSTFLNNLPPNTFSPDLECSMCQAWGQCQSIHGFNCSSVCNASWGQLWSPNTPCYKCDKFGKVEKLKNYSQWGTTQGPCPPGYTKDPNPCMKGDDKFVRTSDDKSEEIVTVRESELVNLIKRVINEREREPGKPKTKPIVTFPLCCLWLCKECKPIFGKGGKLIKHGEGWKNIETGEIMYSEERPKSSVRPVGPGHTKPLTKTKGVRLENHLSRRVIK